MVLDLVGQRHEIRRTAAIHLAEGVTHGQAFGDGAAVLCPDDFPRPAADDGQEGDEEHEVVEPPGVVIETPEVQREMRLREEGETHSDCELSRQPRELV
jgi:hypothetical protein